MTQASVHPLLTCSTSALRPTERIVDFAESDWIMFAIAVLAIAAALYIALRG